MNPTNSTIEKAEEAVQNSLNRFEAAMEHLVEKVEGTTEKLHHVRDVARHSKETLMHFKDEVKATVEPFRPYVKQIRSISTKAVIGARAVPRPFLWIAAGVIGYSLFKAYKGRLKTSTRTGDQLQDFEGEYPYQ